MKRVPPLITLAVVGSVIAFICLVKLPHHVDCAFEIQASEISRVYAGAPGTIEAVSVKPGQMVEEGSSLAVLKNPELEIELAGYKNDEILARLQLKNLKLRGQNEQIPIQQKNITVIQDRIAKTQQKLDRLSVTAPQAGMVLAPPYKRSQESPDGRLPGWHGTPLEERNRGATLTADDLICEIVQPNAFEAVLIIDQGDVQLVKEQQSVDMKLDSDRLGEFSGVIVERSHEPLDVATTSLSSQTGGALQTEIDPTTGMAKPRNISYQARVPLDVEGLPPLRPGYRGIAKIHVAPMTYGQRLWRFVIKTFNFDL